MNEAKKDPNATARPVPTGACVEKQEHKDPITGAHGSHPVGTGIGAAGVGAIGGIAGAVIAGPIGAVAGATAAAVLGGIAGKVTAEAINPTTESDYWRHNYASRPYAQSVLVYEEFAPAYQYGWESFEKRGDLNKSFESIESELGRDWDRVKGGSRLAWNQAKDASRDAWDRVRYSIRGANKRAGG